MSAFSSLSAFGQTVIPLLLFAEAVLELGLFLYQILRSKQPLRSLPCTVHFVILLTLTLLFSVTQGDPDEGKNAFLTGAPWLLFAAVIVLVAIHFVIALPREYRRRKNELSPFSIKEATDKLSMGICFADPDGRIILCNNRMRRLSFALSGHELQITEDLEAALARPDPSVTVKDDCYTPALGHDWVVDTAHCTAETTAYKCSRAGCTATRFADIIKETHTVKVDGGAARVGGQDRQEGSRSETVTLRLGAVPEGKRFKEWEVVSGVVLTNATDPNGASFTMGTVEVEIHAVLEDAPPAAVTYTVTYHMGEGIGGAMLPLTAQSGTSVTLPDCGFTAPGGKEFGGWQIGDTLYQPGDSITVEDDLEVLAIYRDKSPAPDPDPDKPNPNPDKPNPDKPEKPDEGKKDDGGNSPKTGSAGLLYWTAAVLLSALALCVVLLLVKRRKES